MSECRDRRYRLNGSEVEPVMDVVRSRLQMLSSERIDLETAGLLFMVLHRFTRYRVGRPSYPEITWQSIRDLLNVEEVS